MNMRLGLLSALAAGAVAALAAIPAGAFGGARSASGHSVSLDGVRFHPSTLEIRPGETVTWAWDIRHAEHNVSFHGLHSKTGSRGSFTVRFPRAGTFSYLCTVHAGQGMRGKIVVH